MSLEWLVNLLADPICPGPRFLLMSPAANNNVLLFQLLNVLAGDRVLFTHQPQILQRSTGWYGCSPFLTGGLRCITWEHPGPWTTTISFVSRKCMERTSFFKLSRCWLRDLDSLVHFFLIMKMREDRLSASVNIRSGRHSLVIVIVHFELELTLRQLRGRLSIILPHWPAYPCGVGVILCDFNICDPEEGRFNVWNQSFTDGDPGKTAVFHSFFPYVLENAQSDYTRRDSSALGGHSHSVEDWSYFYQSTHGWSTWFPLLFSCCWELREENCSEWPCCSTPRHPETNSSRTRANVFPVGCPNIPFLVLSCSKLHDDHRFSPDPFCVRWLNLKSFYMKPRILESYRSKHLTASGQSKKITSTALRACRNRHLGTLMRCCEAWKTYWRLLWYIFLRVYWFPATQPDFCWAFLVKTLKAREAEVSTLPWTQTEKDIALTRCGKGQRAYLCWPSVLLQMKRATPWILKMTLEEDFANIGEPFSRHAKKKARGITNMKRFCDLLNKLLMTSIGLLIRLSLMTSLLWRKTRLLDLTEFTTVSTDVRNFVETHQQSLTERKELRKFQSSTFETIARRKLIEDQNTILELSGRILEIEKWNKLYEWFKRVSGCWINSQWKFPRYQSTCVFPTSSNTRRTVGTFFWNAEPQRWASKHLGHTLYIGKRFL